MRRMAMDRCLPKVFLAVNKLRGTNHYIIFMFFAVSTSLLLVLNGNVDNLSGVYTIAFLSVMVRRVLDGVLLLSCVCLGYFLCLVSCVCRACHVP